jgi:thiamine kinase
MSPSVGAMRSMTDELLLERAFLALPMLGSISRWQVTALAGGIANRSWLLTGADCKLILRVPINDTRHLGVDRSGERAALAAAARAGLAPQLVYFDVTTGLMLSNYVDGRMWELADAHDPRCVVRLAERLRLLHEIEPPGGARRLDYSKLIPDYRKNLAAQKGQELRASATFDDEADRVLAMVGAVPRAKTLCHNDVHHRNIVDGKSLWLIDWEYAAIGDGLFDLASFACYHELDAGERVRLLEAYAPGQATALAKSFDDHCWLFDYLHLMWLELTATDPVLCHRILGRLG